MNEISDQELESTRISLLKRIQAESSDQILSITTSLKGQYNRIIQNQISRRTRLYRDPIDVLPPEIWIQTIAQAVSYRNANPLDQLLTLKLVSTKWRDAVLSCPELWAVIEIDDEFNHLVLMARLKMCLQLSGNYPLTLLLYGKNYDWELVIPVFRPHAQRIRTIDMGFGSRTSIDEGTRIVPLSQILASFGTLPQLQTLMLHPQEPIEAASFGTFLQNTPSIIRICGQYIPQSALVHVDRNSIKTASVRSELSRLVPWMSRCPSLQALYYASDSLNHEDELTPAIISHTSLKLFMTSSHPTSSLLSIIAASKGLEQLKMKVSWKIMADLMQIMSMLPSLDHLTIEFDSSLNRDDTFRPQIPSTATQLRYLSINHGTVSQSYSASLVAILESNATLLYQTLETYCPKVTDLTIQYMPHPEILPAYLVSLSNLQTLSLYFRSDQALPDSRLAIRSPTEFRIEMRPEDIPQRLPRENRIKFMMRFVAAVARPRGFDLELDPSTYPSLRRLELVGSLVWKPASFTSLQVVTFHAHANANDFCVYLAKRPYDSPSLKRIDFGNLPEWDCLFIMLERRNFLTELNITRIQEISLPSLISTSIARPLSDLLRGSFTVRPSNHELSVAGIGKIYRESTIPGCDRCCMSFRDCHLSIRRDSFGVIPKYSCDPNLEAVIAQPLLPHGLAAWLDGRQSRHDEWAASAENMGGMRREMACNKYKMDDKATVTGFTYDGDDDDDDD